MRNKRKFVLVIFYLFNLLVIGVLGYMILLDVGFVDTLYMTAITISTVGYGEVGIMTDTAKLFTVFLIFSGLITVGYGVTNLVSLFFEGELKAAWRKKRMEIKIQELKNHYIVCGAGDIGRIVINSLGALPAASLL